MTTYCTYCGGQKQGSRCGCEFRLTDKREIEHLAAELRKCKEQFGDIWNLLKGIPKEDDIATAYVLAEAGQDIAHDAAMKVLEMMKP